MLVRRPAIAVLRVASDGEHRAVDRVLIKAKGMIRDHRRGEADGAGGYEPSMLASRQASSSSTPDGRTKTARSQSIASATAEPAAIAPAGAANTAPAAATLSSAGGVALSVLVEVACEDGISLRLLDDSTGTRTPTPSGRLSPRELACIRLSPPELAMPKAF